MRHLSRHVAKTIADLLVTELTALGWVNEPRVFGARAVVVRNIDPDSVNTDQQDPNLVAVWIDDEGGFANAELGGHLKEVMVALEVHLWAENPSIAAALASDVRDVLRDLVMPVTDYTQSPPVASTTVQLDIDGDQVVIERPVGSVTASDFKRNWRIVSAVPTVYVSE